jgi:hypothetical protein
MIKLKSENVEFASNSNLDKNGRVFFWEGDVYRAIYQPAATVHQNLLQKENAASLFDIGLVQTEIAPIDLEGYDLVLKHRKVPFVSYVTEWCGNMLKDAALLTLDLSLALAELGLELQDAHPWNILFDGCEPKFIDFGSIVPIRNPETWLPFREFIGTFYNPLQLMSQGCHDQARSLLVDPKSLRGRRVSNRDLFFTLLKNRKVNGFLGTLITPAPGPKNNRIATINELRDAIEAISIPLSKSSWSDYCDEEVNLTSPENWMIKRQSAFAAISRTRPKTLLDIGSNTGWFSKLAAMQGSCVVALDKDETSINKLYLNDQARRFNILPLSMDFRYPTSAYGIELRCPPAVERLQCEMVLGLAIVHHLVFRQALGFATIIENLASFTNKWLLVEFIPPEDKYVSKWYNDSFAWYTVDGFTTALQKHFRRIEQYPSNPEPRLIFLCER